MARQGEVEAVEQVVLNGGVLKTEAVTWVWVQWRVLESIGFVL